MGNIVKKPLARIEAPDGPIYATEVDGVVVHGGKPVTPESEAAIREIIKAARKYIATRPTDIEGGE